MPIQSANPPDIFTLDQWQGLNQQAKRSYIEDQETFWDENFFPIGPGNLRSCWGPSEPIYTSPGPIIRRIFFGFYGNDLQQYGQPPPGRKGWMFLDDGTIDEVDLDTHEVVHIGNGRKIWTPISPKYWADAVVWRPRWVGATLGEVGGVLFGSPGGATAGSQGGLWAWDGTNLYGPGDEGPDWLTNADTLIGVPIVTQMPYGLPGIYALEVYNTRLWVAGKDVISFSAPSVGTDFTEFDGGGTFGYYGNKLVHDYVDLAATSGYLYVFGDSSTDVISNVQMQAAAQQQPATVNFNYQNVDPMVGQRFPRQVGKWGRYFVMYNGAGIWLMSGSDAQAIGQKVTALLETIDTSNYYPTMATATMNGFRVLLCNASMVDPFGVRRSLLLMWHGTFWSVASQNLELTHIGYYEDNSVCTPYGTDGQHLYRLFDHPDPTLPKRLLTKSWRGHDISRLTIKNFKRLFAHLHDNSGLGCSLTGTITTRGGGVPAGVQDIGFELTAGEIEEIIPQAISGAGISASLELNSVSPDFTIEALHLASEQRTLFGA